MPSRNIGNYTTFNTILAHNVEIQNDSGGLVIYSSDPSNPEFNFSTTNGVGTFTMTGDLDVTGNATFDSLVIGEGAGGFFSLAVDNATDAIDIGIFGEYDNSGTPNFSGLYRDASDTDKKWVFFQDITTKPATTVETLTSDKFASVLLNELYVGNGTASAPSILFNADTNTGLYRVAGDELGFSAGGFHIASIKDASGGSGTQRQLNLNSETTLQLRKLNTIDDAVGTSAFITADMYLTSLDNNDKWLKFYSLTSAATPSYAGTVYSSPSNNYFMTNVNNELRIVYNATAAATSALVDYRSTNTPLIKFHSNTKTQSMVPLVVPDGTVSALGLRFEGSGTETTGFYKNGSGVSIVGAGNNLLTIINSSTATLANITSLLNVSGSVSTPSYSFTGFTGTGLYRSAPTNETLGFAVGGNNAAKLEYITASSLPQFIMPISGTAAVPSFAFDGPNDNSTGIYSPTNEAGVLENHMAFSLGGVETMRLRKRTGTVAQGFGNIDFYNNIDVKPDGTNKVMSVDTNEVHITNTFKGLSGSFQAYNIINPHVFAIYNSHTSATVGTDHSSNANDATIGGGLSILDCESDGTIMKRSVLDYTANGTGSEKYLDLSAHIADFQAFDEFMFGCWFKVPAIAATNTILNIYSSDVKNISISILASGAIEVLIENDATTLQYSTATTGFDDGLWHYLVVYIGRTSSSGRGRVYVDNVEFYATTTDLTYTQGGNGLGVPSNATNAINDTSNITTIAIGGKLIGISLTNKFTGFLKDIYISNSFPSVADITKLYTETYINVYSLDAASITTCSITISDQIYYGDGSVTVPSIAFGNDLNTGIYRDTSSTGIIAFASDGVQSATLSSSLFQVGSNAFNADVTNDWIKLRMDAGSNLGGRLLFGYANANEMIHYIQPVHNTTTITSNYLDFYLSDNLTGGTALGTHNVMRLGQTAGGPINGLLSVFGIIRTKDGSASVPTYAFTNSTSTGMYSSTADTLNFSTGGTNRLGLSTTAITPTIPFTSQLGAVGAPSYSFTGDANTGIYSSAADTLDFTTGGTNRLSISTTAITSTLTAIFPDGSLGTPSIQFSGSTTTGFFRSGGSGSTSVLTLAIAGAANVTFDSVKATFAKNIKITDTTSAANNPTLSLGGTIAGLYSNSGSPSEIWSNTLLGIKANGSSVAAYSGMVVGSTAYFGIGADSAAVMRFASSAHIYEMSCHPTAHDFRVKSVTNSVEFIYYDESATTLQLGPTLELGITSTAITPTVPIRFPNGSVSSPSISFSSSTNAGFYYTGGSLFAAVIRGAKSLQFGQFNSENTISYNNLELRTDEVNKKCVFTRDTFECIAELNVLPFNPLAHFNWILSPSDLPPNRNGISVDQPTIVTIYGTVTHKTVADIIELTDSNGLGLLNYNAIFLPDGGTNGLQYKSNVGNFYSYSVNAFMIYVQFKLESTPTADEVLYILYRNTQYYIEFTVTTARKLKITSKFNNVTVITATSTTAFTLDVWYVMKFSVEAGGHSLLINDVVDTLIYTTGSSTVTSNLLDYQSYNIYLGYYVSGTARDSIHGYIAETFIEPLTTTTSLTDYKYPIYTHSVFTQQLNLVDGTTGLVPEGYTLRSDAGNNLVWDNSIQITPSAVELSKVEIIDVTASEALLVRKLADGGDVFTVNTTNSEIINNGGVRNKFEVNTGTSLSLGRDNYIVELSNTGAVTVTLPDATSTHLGREYHLIKTGASGTITINTTAGDFIDDNATTSVSLTTQFDRITLLCNGVNRWYTM